MLSLQHDTLPPLAGYTEPDPSLPPLRLTVHGAEPHAGRNVLVNASGFGGANAALVFEKPAPPRREQRTPTRRAVITACVALTARDGTLPRPAEARFWPGGRSLPLDRISGLVMSAAERLLGPALTPEIDPAAAVVLGTTYGSQARHERMWAALVDDGPRAVDPNDFALSTFNAPGSAVASTYGYGGANLVILGATAGATAIEESSRLITSGRAHRVLTGAYEEVTPYFQRLLASLGECDAAEAVCLLAMEDEASAHSRGAAALATILGHAACAPAERWPDAEDLLATTRAALSRAAIQPLDIAAVILDPHASTRAAQLDAIGTLFDHGVTLIDPAALYGNCLAASTPLAVNITLDATAAGRWPRDAVLRGDLAFTPGRSVLINACGLMSGCVTLVVQPHARV